MRVQLSVVFAAVIAAGCSRSGTIPAASGQDVHRDSLEWFDSVATQALVWSPADPPDGVLPTLVFSPGFSVAPSQYTELLSSWAREGYLVIAIAHPEFADPDAMELYDASNTIARQLIHAVDHILRERDRRESPLSRVDPERIGLVGHSVGGSAAAQASAWDARVRAAMDLDGTIFGEVVHTGMKQPFFLVRNRISIDPYDPPGGSSSVTREIFTRTPCSCMRRRCTG